MTETIDIEQRIDELSSLSANELKSLWSDLIDHSEPFNRQSYERRIAYRLQEIEFGGLSAKTVRQLEEIGERLDGGNITLRRIRVDDRPSVGTQLVREWKGVEQTVDVEADGYRWNGRPYKSLSAVARAITGTRWNGWAFFGLQPSRGRR